MEDVWDELMRGERDWIWWVYTSFQSIGCGIIVIQLMWGS